jgi:translation elongation factor EF-1alpha
MYVVHTKCALLISKFPAIEVEEANVPWVAAGSNATLSLTTVDPIHLTIGNVLCSTTDLVPLVTTFTARIILFDIQLPITAGTSVCNFESIKPAYTLIPI